MSETVRYETDGAVGVITLNRPDALNAMSGELLDALVQRGQEAAADEAVRCVVVTGAGRAFCSGGDLKGIGSGDELDPLPLLHALAGRGAVCALPAVIGPGRPLAFRRWRPGDALVEARFGLSEPPGTAPPVAPDIVVAPLLAVDRAGRRLGYGGGYYDRTIAALRCRGAVLVVGIGYDVQIRPSVPEGADDRRVDWVVSEKRIFECSEDT